jgi:50S ribosomal protein L16 3-hydroxylase
VQGVNTYIDEVDALSKLVDFIPNWRFDDVMVSYSTVGAGVGAHTDEYDVFIVQGKGSRRWQVGLPNTTGVAEKTILPHPLLKLIDGFDPVIDEVLQSGDAIYIPPKHPHKGQTLAPCLNYSLGFRAPTNLETLTGLLDESDDITRISTRYTDPRISALRPTKQSAMLVTNNEISKLKESIVDLLNSQEAEQALLQYLSRQGLPSIDDFPRYEPQEVEEAFRRGETFERLPGIKAIYGDFQTDTFTFYIDGNKFASSELVSEQIIILLESDEISSTPHHFKDGSLELTQWLNLFTQLLNAGYWCPTITKSDNLF